MLFKHVLDRFQFINYRTEEGTPSWKRSAWCQQPIWLWGWWLCLFRFRLCPITLWDVSDLLSIHWRGCRDAWKTRAHVTINTLPILGCLPSMPRRINNKTILDSLNQELGQLINRLQSRVKQKPRTRDSQVKVNYLNEKNCVHSQTNFSLF